MLNNLDGLIAFGLLEPMTTREHQAAKHMAEVDWPPLKAIDLEGLLVEHLFELSVREVLGHPYKVYRYFPSPDEWDDYLVGWRHIYPRLDDIWQRVYELQDQIVGIVRGKIRQTIRKET